MKILFAFVFITLGFFLCSFDTGLAVPQDTVEDSSHYKIELTQEEKNWVAQNPVVRARVGTNPPLHFWDGQYSGISVDYLNLIAEIIGFQVEYVRGIPWYEAIEDIKTHETFDLLLTAKNTKERQAYMRFSDDYLLMPWVIFSRTKSDFISSVEDLNGKIVAVEKGFVMQKRLMTEYPAINLFESKHSLQALEAVSSGEADAYIGNLGTSSYLINKHNLANLKVACSASFGTHNQAFAVRYDWPEFVSILNKSISAIPARELAELRNEWFNVKFEYGISTADVFKWIGIVVGVSVILLSFFALWNQRLKSEIRERKRVERELTQNEQKFKRIFEEAPLSYQSLNVDGSFIEVNNTWLQTMGYTRNEVIGKKFSDFLPI